MLTSLQVEKAQNPSNRDTDNVLDVLKTPDNEPLLSIIKR